MATADNKIQVNSLTQKPMELLDMIKSKQKQKKLDIKNFTGNLPKKSNDSVRFVLISDTHNKTDELMLPKGDVLIHAGDFTNAGRKSEIKHFYDFIERVKNQFQEIVIICGNRELSFDQNPTRVGSIYLDAKTREIPHTELKERLSNCRYIEDETINVKGFNIYGSPWHPQYRDWSYNPEGGEACLEKWKQIPENTDILITHGPPLGYGDECLSGLRTGCSELLSTIQQRVKPQLHVFGHIHEGYGIWDDGVTKYVNASICTKKKLPINLPVVIDLK